jgi:ribosomal protein S18 acetylase RimI-like enzyme
MADILVDPYPEMDALDRLWRRAWGGPPAAPLAPVLARSLVHVGAFDGDALIGFANVAWDGGIHAFLVDPCVDPDFRGQGIASAMVREATNAARERGAAWLHVDYEPHLEGFYAGCGFRPTKAGVINLLDGQPAI